MLRNIYGEANYNERTYGEATSDICYIAPEPQVISVSTNSAVVKSPDDVPPGFYLELYSRSIDSEFSNLEATNVVSSQTVNVGTLSDIDAGSTYRLFWKVVHSELSCPNSPEKEITTLIICPKPPIPIIPFVTIKRNSASIEVPNGLPTSVIALNLEMRRMESNRPIEEWRTFMGDVKNEASITVDGLDTGQHYQFRFIAICEE